MQTVTSWELGRNSAGYQGPICESHLLPAEDKLAAGAVQMTSRNVGWPGQAGAGIVSRSQPRTL